MKKGQIKSLPSLTVLMVKCAPFYPWSLGIRSINQAEPGGTELLFQLFGRQRQGGLQVQGQAGPGDVVKQ